jgi:hypothetical protein
LRPIPDPITDNGFYHVVGEAKNLIFGRPSNPSQLWIGANTPVNVTDGRLTISSGASAQNNKINFIEVTKAAPSMPSSLSATVLSATEVRFNWTDNAINEDGYVVERLVSGSNTWTAIGNLAASATQFIDSAALPSVTYFYRVCAFNDVGQTTSNTIAMATTPRIPELAPDAPSNLAASLTGNVVTLTWADNSNSEDKFIIEAGFNNSFSALKEVGANQTSTTVFIGTGQLVQYRVKARNTAGGDSGVSNAVTLSTPPDVPIYANAQPVSSSAIQITWDSNDSCQFHVQRLTNGQWITIAQDLLDLTFADTGLAAGTAQSYRIIAVGPTGESAPSDVASATTAPAAVIGLHVTNVASTSVSLQWDDGAGEAGYLVERSTDGVNWTTAKLTFANVTSHTVMGLVTGQTYFFRVTGFANGVVPGDRGEVVSATPGTTTDDLLPRLRHDVRFQIGRA